MQFFFQGASAAASAFAAVKAPACCCLLLLACCCRCGSARGVMKKRAQDDRFLNQNIMNHNSK